MPDRISPDDLGALIQGHVDAQLEELALNPPRDAWKAATGFNVVSLGQWIGICERAGVDHVPAEPVATADIVSLLNWDAPSEDQIEVLRGFFAEIEKAKQPGMMLRWDMCAPLDVKMRLSQGQPEWSERLIAGFTIDDPRAFELLFEYPGEEITVWRRPWLEADIVDNYPVEYRVFVEDGRPIGVSSYYPQRDLPDGGQVRADLAQSVDAACRLAAHLPDEIDFPGSQQHWPSDSKSFTADFMRLSDGRLLFLEAGPPFDFRGVGADPCCFPADPRAWAEATEFHIDTVAGPVPVVLTSHRDLRHEPEEEPAPGL